MLDCECLSDCPYFESGSAKEISTVGRMRREEYCNGDYTKCARYMVFKALGKENVPRDLLPFQTDKAKQLIERNKKLN